MVEDAVNDAAIGDAFWVWLDWVRVDCQVLVHLVGQNFANVLVDWVDWGHGFILLMVLQERAAAHLAEGWPCRTGGFCHGDLQVTELENKELTQV
jgi:hypothetical protein